MKKFTVITKDGSKWLRPVNPHPEKLSTHGTPEAFYYNPEWQEFEKNNFDVPYLGSRPDGTTLDESEVREVRQMRYEGKWVPAEEDLIDFAYLETRTAYVDVARKAEAESHDRHISDNPRYPLFSHMSSEHGLTLLDSELDEIARHAAPMTGVEYWKERCKVAEQLVGIGFLHVEFMNLLDRCGKRDKYDEWKQIIEEGRAYGN